MRVIAGEFRSRRLKSPPGLETRPTPDRLRESLFSILAPRIEGVVFVDAYAGCGSVGIEALSRGAREAIFIERSRECLGVLEENIRSLHLEGRSRVIRGSAATYLRSLHAGIYFLDPPYDRAHEYQVSLDALGDHASAIVIAQHPPRLELAERYRRLVRYRVVRHGDNCLSFFEAAPDS